MPRVPVATNNGPAPAPGPSGGLQAPDYGPGIGPGLRALGQGIGEAAQVSEQQKIQLDDANIKNLDNQYVTHSDAVLHTGDNPYLATTGQSALDGRAAAEKALQTQRDALVAQATSPYQRRRLGEILDQRFNADMRNVGDHYAEQHTQYDVDQSTARAGIQAATAGNNFADPGKAEDAIGTLKTEYENLAHLKGWSPEVLSFQQQRVVSGVRKDIVGRLAASGESGPAVAQAYLDKFSGQFTSDDAASSQTAIRTFQNHYDAQARAAAADARRAQRESEQDNAAKAEDTLRVIEAGGTVPPGQLADARTAAAGAGPRADGLRFRMETADVKNGLATEFRSATPQEIQQAADEAGAKVAQGGDHVDARVATAASYLKSLASSSAQEARNSPLHWAAAHQGVAIQPLNFGDPNSVTQRVKVADTVAARLGMPAQYLTPEEAAKEAPIWKGQDIAAKTGLISRLASAGAVGARMATQIAPDDPTLSHLVGLASLPDRAVGASIVNAAMAGPEALKVHKGLAGPNQQTIPNDYATVVGHALDMMPSTAAGTLNVARNYYAGKMAAGGVYQYDGKTFAHAVDTALGGYNDHGVKRGGLGVRNGDTTVLPVGVSQDEFDTKLSRQTAASFDTSDNGLPVWGNGNPLKVSDVKRASLRPVGDGVYRLFVDGAYVQRKGGGYYQLDWRKLR